MRINLFIILQIFSVRVRDKGPDYRGFVHYNSTLNSNNNNDISDIGSSNINHYDTSIDEPMCTTSSSSFSCDTSNHTGSSSILGDIESGTSGASLQFGSGSHFDTSIGSSSSRDQPESKLTLRPRLIVT